MDSFSSGRIWPSWWEEYVEALGECHKGLAFASDSFWIRGTFGIFYSYCHNIMHLEIG